MTYEWWPKKEERNIILLRKKRKIYNRTNYRPKITKLQKLWTVFNSVWVIKKMRNRYFGSMILYELYLNYEGRTTDMGCLIWSTYLNLVENKFSFFLFHLLFFLDRKKTLHIMNMCTLKHSWSSHIKKSKRSKRKILNVVSHKILIHWDFQISYSNFKN